MFEFPAETEACVPVDGGISRSTELEWKRSMQLKSAMKRSSSLIPVVREGDGERRRISVVFQRHKVVGGGVQLLLLVRRRGDVEFSKGSRGEAMVAV